MVDVHLDESSLHMAARLLINAAAALQENRALPMLLPATYTGVGSEIGAFIEAASVGLEAVSDASGEAAATVAAIMTESTQVEAEISGALGTGFVR